ncbi:hypothetical protein [Rhizobium sp.]
MTVIFGPVEVVAAFDLDVMLEAKAKDLANQSAAVRERERVERLRTPR